jgi:hypothetical protein
MVGRMLCRIDMHRMLCGLRRGYALGHNSRSMQTQALSGKLPPETRDHKIVFHAIICRHSMSCHPTIYTNPLQIVRIIDVPEAESDDILEMLFEAIRAAGTRGVRMAGR